MADHESSDSLIATPSTPNKKELASQIEKRNFLLDSKDVSSSHLFTKEVAEKLIKDMVVPELTSAVHRTVRILQRVEDNITAFETHFTLTEGVYLAVSIYKTETALGDQVIKGDHWEGIQQLKRDLIIEGAPNFRQIDNTVLCGAGQPSVDGVRNLLSKLMDQGFKKIIWVNLREEPVTYINGLPFAPRDPETLNINLEHLIGIDNLELEAMEQRLKADIKLKAFQSGNNEIQYYFQNKDMQNELNKIEVTQNTVQTPRDIFNLIKNEEKLDISYHRIPITDECAPEEKDFDELLQMLKECPQTTAVVMNCQMGRGRTTTGLVVAYLIMYTHKYFKNLQFDLPVKRKKDLIWDVSHPNYEKGEYQGIAQLLLHLDYGVYIKAQVDHAIDACAHFQNLRLAILDCKNKVDKGENVKKHLKTGLNYLERYWWLIVFNAYLTEQGPEYSQPFSTWMRQRWGLRRLLKKLELR